MKDRSFKPPPTAEVFVCLGIALALGKFAAFIFNLVYMLN
jgi:hypothetical protein